MANFFKDVIQHDARFHSANRIADLALLEPTFRAKVETIIEKLAEKGLEMMVFETFRSQERQLQLYQQHATQLKKVGVHHFGLACDVVFKTNNQPSWSGDFKPFGTLAREEHLVWGGDWKTFVDKPHIQWCSLSKQPALFSGHWYPSANYDPTVDEHDLACCH